MSLGHLRHAFITLANPEKNTVPLAKFSMATSSSKLAPAQNARSPSLLTIMTTASLLDPSVVIVFASCLKDGEIVR
jgi:hypothetical protein